MNQHKTLYMVVPCYNEEEVLHETAKRLTEKYTSLISRNLISPESRVVFVDDGSKDKTWEIICSLHESQEMFSGIKLSRNSGHQNAVLAGLMTVRTLCDMAITMDADLQDDINAIDEMVIKFHEGNQVVYGVRSARKTDTFFKKFTAESFYKFMKVMGADVVYNHADFRLMSARVLEELSNCREVNLFLRGLVRTLGFKSCNVMYERAERFAGESKYPLKKMLSFALNAITSFSTKPLKLITSAGLIMSIISVFAIIWSIVVKLTGNAELGWSSTVCSIWFIGGLQLLALGIIGEYIGRIYDEVKQRPRYIVEEFINEQ
ncbi:MAG: glycosyltransferase family 2 protein [Ruminococcus flavefaciens]|nr:glycosyltransferase family 2 protein [Ruminococcus flavefaciens]MCM1231228.1 glycosyltransferase family 2 protein [Ruminococcus flavefaciens]